MYLKYQNFYLTIICLIFLTLLIFINVAQAENLIFTELMYNPEGTDTDQEWIEVFNLSTSTIEINSNWRFNDGSNHLLDIYQGQNQIASTTFFIIAAQAENFLNIYPSFTGTLFESSLNLNNSADTIQLINNDEIITEFTYNSDLGADGNGKTLEKIDIYNSNNNWQESYVLNGTPGAESSTPPLNQAPIAIAGEDITTYIDEEITLDASNSYDPDNDLLYFVWNLDELNISNSPTTTYQFSEPNTYTINLTVSDGQATSSDFLVVTVEEQTNLSPVLDDVIINELLPNPEGSDDAEWIELKNESNDIIDLENFYIEDASGNRYTFSSEDFGNLDIHDYFILERSISGISLNNLNETISLFNILDEKIDEVSYIDSQENYSWARFDNQWKQTSLLTKGYQNQEEIIQNPIANINLLSDVLEINQEIILNAEESEDPNGQNLEYKWYINDSLKNNNSEYQVTFSTSGLKEVKLKVINESNLGDETIIYLYIIDPQKISEITENNDENCSFFNEKIIINEILPNPEGSDDAEWIELYNPNSYNIDLNNWTLQDKTSSFNVKEIINAKNYLLIKRESSQIALNNSNEELKLFDCQDNLINELAYAQSFEGQSYAYDINNEEYFWTADISPNEKNNISDPSKSISLENEISLTEESHLNFVEISDIKNLEKNEEVLVNGIIISLPHEIYKNTAYICYYNINNQSPDLNECIAIYFKEEWPNLNYGDLVQVQGKINHLKNYSRLKIESLNNLLIIKEQITFDFDSYYLEELEEEMNNSFVSVNGQISKLNKKSFYITDEEEMIKFKIKINNDEIQLNEFSKNDSIQINGLLTLYSEDLILIPRNEKDLIRIQNLNQEETINEKQNTNTSTNIVSLDNINSEKNNTTDWILGSGLITTLGFIFKNKIISLFKK